MKGIQAPVIRVFSTLNQLPFLQVVQYRHQPAGVNLQPPRHLLLAQSGRSAQQAQDSRICRRKFEKPQSFRKLRRGVRPQLGKQEGRLSSSHVIFAHLEKIIAHFNRLCNQ